MVWIHGGALKLGFASDFGTAGTVRNLVSRGVVVVTIQYRLGVLGILKRTFDFLILHFLLQKSQFSHGIMHSHS